MTKRINDTTKRRKQILKSARKVFLQKGFYGASIDDIAAEEGVVRGTILHYFKSKQELMEAVLESTGEDIVPVLSRIMEDNKISAGQRIDLIIKLCRKQFEAVKPQLMNFAAGNQEEEFRYLMDQMRLGVFYKMSDLLEKVLQEGCQKGEFHIEDTKARANAIVFGIFGLTGASISSESIIKETQILVDRLIYQ